MRLAVFASLTLLLVAAPAAADPFPRSFRLDVARNTCVDAPGLREALAVALRSDPVAPGARDAVAVEVLAGQRLARARWRILDAQGDEQRSRTVTVTGGCEVLVRELALSLAVAYETDAPPPPPPPAVGCDAACRARIRDEVRAELCNTNPRSCHPVDLTPVLLAGGMMSAGLTTDVGGGAWLAGELRFGDMFSAAAEARVLFPAKAVPTFGDPFSVTAAGLAVVPCMRWWWILGCLSADIGFLALGGISRPAGDPILASFGFGPRAAVQIPLTSRFGMRVFADLRIAPIPSKVRFIDPEGATWQTGAVTGLFGAGFSFE